MAITLFQSVVLVGWTVAMFWASVMAIRSKRIWPTSLLAIGSACMLIGVLGVAASTAISEGNYYLTTIMNAVMEVVATGSVYLVFLGLLGFTIGVTGVCARFGLAERRAEELEHLVAHLQQSGDSGK